MKASRIGLAAAVMVAAAGFGRAQEPAAQPPDLPEVVVSATRSEMAATNVSSAVTVISAADIERRRQISAADALKHVPGVHVAQHGGMGSTASVFVRGAEAEQTLVLIDGVELNDPGSAGRGADLANLDLANVERIEVLRGPQSGLYGSDAMGGVITVVTKKGEGPPGGYVSADAGSYSTFREAAGVNGGTPLMNYSFSASRVDSEGFSAADEKLGNTEKDGYDRTALSGRMGWTPAETFGFDAFVRYSDASTEYDNGGGPGADAPDNVADVQSWLVRGEGNLSLMDSRWQQRLGASIAAHDRTFTDDWGKTTFDSQLNAVDWQNDLHLDRLGILTAGVDYQDEEAKTDGTDDASSDVFGFFLQDQYRFTESLTAVGSARLDRHDSFGSEATYRLAPLYSVHETGTRFKASFGTGFKAPSLYQLYAPATAWGPIGNEDLDPETSTGWDAGVEQDLLDRRLTVGATYFGARYRDMIDFENGYVNRAEVDSQGVETMASLHATEDLSVGLTYTYTQVEDGDTGKQLNRRPEHRATMDANYAFCRRGNVNLSVLWVGERTDRYYDNNMFGFVDKDLDDYALVNLAGSYDLTKSVQVYARIDNVFDKDYQDVYGYGTAGLGAYGGVKISL